MGESKHGAKGAANMDWDTPQFQKSPTIFDNHLGKKIGKLEKENLDKTLLQCVDYILPATKTESKCLDATVSLLNFLGQSWYGLRVSKRMAQIGKEAVIYLRDLEGKKEASEATEKKSFARLQSRGLQAFLGMARWWVSYVCQLWCTGKTLVWHSTEKYLA